MGSKQQQWGRWLKTDVASTQGITQQESEKGRVSKKKTEKGKPLASWIRCPPPIRQHLNWSVNSALDSRFLPMCLRSLLGFWLRSSVTYTWEGSRWRLQHWVLSTQLGDLDWAPSSGLWDLLHPSSHRHLKKKLANGSSVCLPLYVYVKQIFKEGKVRKFWYSFSSTSKALEHLPFSMLYNNGSHVIQIYCHLQVTTSC